MPAARRRGYAPRMPVTTNDLRAHAVTRSLFSPTGLEDAVRRVGFVQADPIRAPARAQDLILRHRARAYRAGDLERRYPTLEEIPDFRFLLQYSPHISF